MPQWGRLWFSVMWLSLLQMKLSRDRRRSGSRRSKTLSPSLGRSLIPPGRDTWTSYASLPPRMTSLIHLHPRLSPQSSGWVARRTWKGRRASGTVSYHLASWISNIYYNDPESLQFLLHLAELNLSMISMSYLHRWKNSARPTNTHLVNTRKCKVTFSLSAAQWHGD